MEVWVRRGGKVMGGGFVDEFARGRRFVSGEMREWRKRYIG